MSWDGGGDGVNWTDANNWSTNALPGIADDVTINVAANPTIILNGANAVINSLNSAEALNLSSGVLNVAAASTVSASLTLSGATLTGAGNLTLTGTGGSWTGGSMTGTGRTILASGATLTSSGGNTKGIRRTLEVRGTFVYAANSQSLAWDSNGRVEVASGGVFNYNDDDYNNNFGGTGTLAIAAGGTFNKTAAGTVSPNVNLENAGTVNVDAGTFSVQGGVNTGTISIDAGAILTFNSDYTHTGILTGAGAASFGSGTHVFDTGATVSVGTFGPISGGTVTLNIPLTVNNLLFTGGTINGTANLTLTGTGGSWTGGSMTGTGRTILASGATLTSSGGNTKGIRRTLEVRGTFVYAANSQSLAWDSNGRVEVASGGVFNYNDDDYNNNFGGTGTLAIAAGGTFNKTAAGTVSPNVNLENAGTVNVDAGTFSVQGGVNTGTISIDAGAILTFNSDYTHTGILTGAGAASFGSGTHVFDTGATVSVGTFGPISGGTVTLNIPLTVNNLLFTGGTINGTANLTLTGTGGSWTGGSMTGTGRTILASGATLTSSGGNTKGIRRTLEVRGTFVYAANSQSLAWDSNGRVEVASGGVFNYNDDDYNNNFGGTGTLAIAAGGTFNKTAAGTVSPNVNLENAGTVNVDAGTFSIGGTSNIGAGAFLSSGRYFVRSGTTLNFSSPITTLTADVEIDGNGSVPQLAGLLINRGRIGLTGGADVTLPATAPTRTYTHEGILDLSPGSTFTVNGNVRLAGTSQPIIRTELASVSNFGRVTITGSLDLNSPDSTSRLDPDLVGGYDPAPGTAHNVIIANGGIVNAFDGFLGGSTPSNNTLLLTKPDASTIAIDVGTGAPPAAPQILSQAFEFQTREAILFNFSINVSAFLSRKDYFIQNLTTGTTLPQEAGTLSYNTTSNQAVLTLTNQLPDGNYRLTVNAPDIANAAGVPASGAPIILNFFVLKGDANRDRTVNFDDLLITAQNYGLSGRTFTQGNFNYDAAGEVGFDDLLLLAQRYGQSVIMAAPKLTDKRRSVVSEVVG